MASKAKKRAPSMKRVGSEAIPVAVTTKAKGKKAGRRAASPQDKVAHLTVLLLKQNFDAKGSALKDSRALRSCPIDSAMIQNGILFVDKGTPKPPKWMNFIGPAVSGGLADVKSTIVSAVLFVEAAGRTFAVTFGYGRGLLKSDCFERDFGLKVVLNRVDPDSIRSLDVRNFEELTIHTRRQTSRGSSLDTFGLNVQQDLLRSVTGTPKNAKFARRVTGSDALTLAVPLKVSDLPKKCEELLVAYADTQYKQRFDFIDQLRAVRDPALTVQLDAELVRAVGAPHANKIHLAPPEPMEWERVEGFTYPGRHNANPQPDLAIDDYKASLSSSTPISVDLLRAGKVGVRFRDANASVQQWSVYDAIVFEVHVGGKMYVLTGGDWFEVAPDFAKRVEDRVVELSGNAIVLDDAVVGESEGVYNSRVASNHQFALLDCKLNNSQKTPVEVCDIFTPSRQFVHVKRKTRSATLSHLFAQGVVSAEAFLSDQLFRQETRNIVQRMAPTHAPLIPIDRPDPATFEVVYAVIAKPEPDWPRSLPFFSQLNLVNASNRLAMLGFKVSLAKIDEK